MNRTRDIKKWTIHLPYAVSPIQQSLCDIFFKKPTIAIKISQKNNSSKALRYSLQMDDYYTTYTNHGNEMLLDFVAPVDVDKLKVFALHIHNTLPREGVTVTQYYH